MEGGISMRFLLILLFFFTSSFILGKNLNQEIIKINIVVKGRTYISYVILSSREKPNSFFIVGEKL